MEIFIIESVRVYKFKYNGILYEYEYRANGSVGTATITEDNGTVIYSTWNPKQNTELGNLLEPMIRKKSSK